MKLGVRIAIVDDAEGDRELLAGIVEMVLKRRGYQVLSVDLFASGDLLMREFASGRYDLVFLDICMVGMSGIETAKKIRNLDSSTAIVFSTSSNDYASESYSVQAQGYILKPYGQEDLDRLISRLESNGLEKRRILELPDGRSVLLHSIIHTAVSGHYVSIYLISGECVRVRTTQSAIAQVLLQYPNFVLCNKGMIVNVIQISCLEADCAVMKNGARVPVSRRRAAQVKQCYCDYQIEMLRKGYQI